jgi:glycogen(starch) synthase
MRVVLITPEYPPAKGTGGIGTNASTVARALAARGHEVRVVARDGPAREEIDGLELVRLETQWLPNPYARRLLALRRAAAAARSFRPQVIQAPEWAGEAWWASHFGRTPVVTRLATPTYLIERLNRGSLDPDTRFVRWLERAQTRQSAGVFAPTSAIAKEVEAEWALGAGRVDVIPNPVDLADVRSAAARRPPLELRHPALVFIGRLERRKGIDELAGALPQLLDQDRRLHAYLVGRDPGEEGGALTARFWDAVAPVADRVHMVGELPRPEALSIVARADVVALPSRWESFGYVAVEAMALGRPVVATETGGFAELIEDGRTGWLVPPGDPEALLAGLAKCLADPAAARIGEQARAAAERFDADNVIEQVEALFERVSRRPSFDRSIYRSGYRHYFRPDERSGPFHGLYAAKRAAILREFDRSPPQTILDVGGGYGRLAAPLARRHHVPLADVSPEMLEEARRRCPPAVRLVEADALALPFADGEFDTVLAIDLVPHLPELAVGLDELARVTRRGGRLVFDTTNALPLWVLAYPSYVNWRPRRLLATIRGDGVLPEWQANVLHHRASTVRETIAEIGLTLERRTSFGPPLVPKWHLWWTRKP